MKAHHEFKTLLRELRSEVREKDYVRLNEFHRYLIVVLLDIARTKSERMTKVEVMSAHYVRIKETERTFTGIIEYFVQPILAHKQEGQKVTAT